MLPVLAAPLGCLGPGRTESKDALLPGPFTPGVLALSRQQEKPRIPYLGLKGGVLGPVIRFDGRFAVWIPGGYQAGRGHLQLPHARNHEVARLPDLEGLDMVPVVHAVRGFGVGPEKFRGQGHGRTGRGSGGLLVGAML